MTNFKHYMKYKLTTRPSEKFTLYNVSNLLLTMYLPLKDTMKKLALKYNPCDNSSLKLKKERVNQSTKTASLSHVTTLRRLSL